jgi:hypothetical protein
MNLQVYSTERMLLTKRELANRYGVVTRTIDNWMTQKRIPFLKLSAELVRFDPVACDNALKRFQVGPR